MVRYWFVSWCSKVNIKTALYDDKNFTVMFLQVSKILWYPLKLRFAVIYSKIRTRKKYTHLYNILIHLYKIISKINMLQGHAKVIPLLLWHIVSLLCTCNCSPIVLRYYQNFHRFRYFLGPWFICSTLSRKDGMHNSLLMLININCNIHFQNA